MNDPCVQRIRRLMLSHTHAGTVSTEEILITWECEISVQVEAGTNNTEQMQAATKRSAERTGTRLLRRKSSEPSISNIFKIDGPSASRSCSKTRIPTCGQCGDEALRDGSGECPRCIDLFCSRHVNRSSHSCIPCQRCTVCRDLVLIAGDRYKCKECKQPLCRQHMHLPCDQHRDGSTTKLGGCLQQ